jgi:hypothetical protein
MGVAPHGLAPLRSSRARGYRHCRVMRRLVGNNRADFPVPGIRAIETIVRTLIMYLVPVVGLRVAGERELTRLNSLDIAMLLKLSNTLQNAITGNEFSVSGGIQGAAALPTAP